MKKFLLLVSGFTALFSAHQAKAQDPEFTQFFASPVYTNPAFAGTSGGGRIVLNYRNQWPALPGTFRTFAGSYDEQFAGIGGGLGIIAMQDVAGQGMLKTTTAAGVYSYEIPVTRHFTMRAGIQAQFFQRSIDFDKLRWGDQIVPRRGFVNLTKEAPPNNSIAIPNFSAGILGYTNTFYFGAAVHNMTEPNQSFYKTPGEASNLPRRYTAHAGMTIPLTKSRYNESSISPNILFMRQKEFTQVNLGFYINKGPLVTGLWFRQTAPNSDAMMVLVGFRKDKFKFGYSYDLTISEGRSALTGSHEISAAIEWRKSYRGRKFRPLVCPKF
ncbi:MAG: type IX secretion system membrane protein PorP/SprF [Bacteroidia bacterium]